MIDIEREYEILDFKARLLRAEIAMHGMVALNKQREIQGNSLGYGEMDFASIIDEFGIGDNCIPTYRG